MQENDWNNCQGEVFKIHREKGRGKVKVGDTIAISYSREIGKWFSCAGRLCGKATCPGHSCNSRSGFSSPHKWNQCGGEVFKMYARGKRVGASIYSRDHVILYYVSGRDWVGLVGRHPDHRGCPGKHLPPPSQKYDSCWGEVFDVWVRIKS